MQVAGRSLGLAWQAADGAAAERRDPVLCAPLHVRPGSVPHRCPSHPTRAPVRLTPCATAVAVCHHPLAPLLNGDTAVRPRRPVGLRAHDGGQQELSPAYSRAITRIFRSFDKDGDRVLCDEELRAMQVPIARRAGPLTGLLACGVWRAEGLLRPGPRQCCNRRPQAHGCAGGAHAQLAAAAQNQPPALAIAQSSAAVATTVSGSGLTCEGLRALLRAIVLKRQVCARQSRRFAASSCPARLRCAQLVTAWRMLFIFGYGHALELRPEYCRLEPE
jgi:hypothetical protein